MKRATLMILGFVIIPMITAAVMMGNRAPHASPACQGCNIILISIDTLRADRLGAYGHGRHLTPYIDRLATEGVLFENMYSQSPTTAPSHMSMMTSRYPSEHRLCGFEGSMPGPGSRCEPGLDPSIPTLAEMLQAGGYYAAAYTGGAQIHGSLGFERGFNKYHNSKDLEWFVGLATALDDLLRDAGGRPFFLFFHTYKTHDPYLPSASSAREICGTYDGPVVDSFAKLIDRTIESLRQDPNSSFSRAFFEELADEVNGSSDSGKGLLAILERGPSEENARLLAAALEELRPTEPSFRGSDVRDSDGTFVFRYPSGNWDVSFSQYLTFYQKDLTQEDLAYISCLYDAEIHEMDQSIGLLLNSLDRKGLTDDTVIVFTSDHGEEFHEHGGFLHEYLYEEILRVPLIIRIPGMEGGPLRIGSPARTIDIFPSVLDILGIQHQTEVRGKSLLSQPGTGAATQAPLFAESLDIQYAITDSVGGKTYKLIEDHRQQLFALDDDPHEQKDLAGDLPDVAGALSRRLAEHKAESAAWWDSEPRGVRTQEMADELRGQLESLGYVS